jgi:hypothetical protein
MRVTSMASLVAVVLVVSGCRYNKHPIPVEEIRQLDGFSDGQEAVLIDKAGERFPFTGSSRLTILPMPYGFREIRFREIQVSETEFRGLSEKGGVYIVDLDRVRRAFVENVDPCRSVVGGLGDGAIVAARVVLVTTIVVGVLVGYAYAAQHVEMEFGET